MSQQPPITIPLVLTGPVLEQLLERLGPALAEIVAGASAAAPSSPWMTTEEAAEYLRIPIGTFRKLAAARQVPLIEEGSRLYFDRDALDEWRRGGGSAAMRLAA